MPEEVVVFSAEIPSGPGHLNVLHDGLKTIVVYAEFFCGWGEASIEKSKVLSDEVLLACTTLDKVVSQLDTTTITAAADRFFDPVHGKASTCDVIESDSASMIVAVVRDASVSVYWIGDIGGFVNRSDGYSCFVAPHTFCWSVDGRPPTYIVHRSMHLGSSCQLDGCFLSRNSTPQLALQVGPRIDPSLLMQTKEAVIRDLTKRHLWFGSDRIEQGKIGTVFIVAPAGSSYRVTGL